MIETPDVKVVYVAGPYRASTVYGIHANIMHAETCAVALWRMGFTALCPHKNSAYLDGIVPDELILNGDLELLRRCDAVCLVGNWEASIGATLEKTRAELLDKPLWVWNAANPEIVQDLYTQELVVRREPAPRSGLLVPSHVANELRSR